MKQNENALLKLNDDLVGMDLTEYLNVKKFEKIIPANLAGKIRGNFPSFIPKTDQERIQNFIKDFLTSYRDHTWEVSLKLDGSSMTVYFDPEKDHFGVCGRNWELTETEGNSYWVAARKLDLEKKLRACGLHYAIQGELVGPSIQNNFEKFKALDFYVFDIYDIEHGVYLDSKERQELCLTLELNHVPVYETAKMGYDDSEGFLSLAEYGYEGKSIHNNKREGLVFKSMNDPKVSFKAISQTYLLSED